jgi:hypothetical protein
MNLITTRKEKKKRQRIVLPFRRDTGNVQASPATENRMKAMYPLTAALAPEFLAFAAVEL